MGSVWSRCCLPSPLRLQITWLDESHFAVACVDHPASVWQTAGGLRVERRLPEVVGLIARHSDEQFAALSANRLRLYRQAECRAEIRIRSEFIQGSLSALECLPLNGTFLAGSSNGMIRLAC